jgi:hypothetical protein
MPAGEPKIVLWHGIQSSEGIASLAAGRPVSSSARHLGDGCPLLPAGQEGGAAYVLYPGDTIPLRDQARKRDRIDNPDRDDWLAHLARVA